MTQLRRAENELNRVGLKVFVITFDDSVLARNYVASTGLPWPLLIDRQRQAYRAYGMERASWWQLYHPGSLLRYLKLLALGQRPGRPGEDWHQLGGDVLIDPQGIVRLHHVSQDPHDRPSVDQILAALKKTEQASSQGN
ncbi:MAG: hypothetical protein KatS3mg111_1608 [Pirellulaceae bacterium]|nr:MAG: hypothetical protein KatS3mg111_1608 [Pirellulaceae bacterium]